MDYQFALIKAAKAAGVQHFFPSDFGSDYDVIPRSSAVYDMLVVPKVPVHEAVKASGMDWTFIANGWFAEFLYGLPFMSVDIASRTVTAPVSFDTTTTVTSLTDIARLSAAAVVDPNTRNKQLYFGKRYTYEQIAQALEQATGDKVTRKVASKVELEVKLAANPKDMGTRFVLGLTQRGNSFPDSTTYKHGQYTYVTLEQVARKVISAPRPALH